MSQLQNIVVIFLHERWACIINTSQQIVNMSSRVVIRVELHPGVVCFVQWQKECNTSHNEFKIRYNFQILDLKLWRVSKLFGPKQIFENTIQLDMFWSRVHNQNVNLAP